MPRFGITDFGMFNHSTPSKKPALQGPDHQERPWFKSKKLNAALKQLPDDQYTYYAFVQPSKAGERIQTRVEIIHPEKGIVAQKTFPQWKGIHAAAHWVRTMAKQLKRQDKA